MVQKIPLGFFSHALIEVKLLLEGIRASISKETYIATCDFPWGPPPPPPTLEPRIYKQSGSELFAVFGNIGTILMKF